MVINVYFACVNSKTDLMRIHAFNTLFYETMKLQNLYFFTKFLCDREFCHERVKAFVI